VVGIAQDPHKLPEYPAEQGVHAASPAAEDESGGQTVHVAEPAAEYLPATQSAHWLDP